MNPPSGAPRSRLADAVLAASFLAAIVTPLVVQTLGLSAGRLAENRHRAPRPSLGFNRTSLASFPARFEAYYNDSFGLRDQLIRWNSRAKVALGISPSRDVLIGKRGWLYLASGCSVDDIRRSHPLEPAALEQWGRSLEERRQWLARKGIKYLFVIAPSKHTIYPEFVAGRFDRVSSLSRYDQLVGYLRENTQVETIDLRPPLEAAKARTRVYYRRDTHWNDEGAFVGYHAIVDTVSRWFPRVEPLRRSTFRRVGATHDVPDLSLMLGLAADMPERAVRLKPTIPRKAHPVALPPGMEGALAPPQHVLAIERDDPSLPRAMVYGDSFSGPMVPFLSEHFSRSLYLWGCEFDQAIIEREQPQVVIEEAVERRLWYPPPTADLPVAAVASKPRQPGR